MRSGTASISKISKLPRIDFRGLTGGYWFCLDCIELAIAGKIGWLSMFHARGRQTRCPLHHDSRRLFYRRDILSTPVHSYICRRCGLTLVAEIEISGKAARCCYYCAAQDLLEIKASKLLIRKYHARYRSAMATFGRDFDRLARSLPVGHNWSEEERLREQFERLAEPKCPGRDAVFAFVHRRLARGTPNSRLLAGYLKSSGYSLTQKQYDWMAAALSAAVASPGLDLDWCRRILDFARALLKAAIRIGHVFQVRSAVLKTIRMTKWAIKHERAKPRPDAWRLKQLARATADLERELRSQ
jgi:hypothetical protein